MEENKLIEILNLNSDSIEVTKTTRGYTFSVKKYSKDLNTALKEIGPIIEELKRKFPSE